MTYKLIFLLFLSMSVLSAEAQFRKIPPEVTDAFRSKYDSATQVSWRDNIINFQANFKMGQRDMRAYYSTKGEWLKTERTSSLKALPEPVRDGFKKSKYVDWPVNEVLYIEDSNQQAQYRIQVRKGDFQKKNLYFSASGRLLDDAITL